MPETPGAPATTDGQGAAILTPATPNPSTSAALTAQPPPAAPAATPSWMDGLDEASRGFIQNKHWENPSDLLQAYRGAEKFIAAPVESRLVIPGPDAPPEEMAKFYEKIGRPSAPDGYKLDVPEGAPKEFASKAAEWFFNHGVPKAAAEGVAKDWNAFMTEQKTAQDTQKTAAFQEEDRALKQAWGAAFTQELAKAQAAVRALGVTQEQIDALQASMGHKATMEFFNKLGSKMDEPGFTTGQDNKGFGSAMTPEAAKATIKAKMEDKDFSKRYLAKDVNALAEMARLHEFAYPPEQA